MRYDSFRRRLVRSVARYFGLRIVNEKLGKCRMRGDLAGFPWEIINPVSSRRFQIVASMSVRFTVSIHTFLPPPPEFPDARGSFEINLHLSPSTPRVLRPGEDVKIHPLSLILVRRRRDLRRPSFFFRYFFLRTFLQVFIKRQFSFHVCNFLLPGGYFRLQVLLEAHSGLVGG